MSMCHKIGLKFKNTFANVADLKISPAENSTQQTFCVFTDTGSYNKLGK